jgi:hypothetical protein
LLYFLQPSILIPSNSRQHTGNNFGFAPFKVKVVIYKFWGAQKAPNFNLYECAKLRNQQLQISLSSAKVWNSSAKTPCSLNLVA